jgi:hypothetical protein
MGLLNSGHNNGRRGLARLPSTDLPTYLPDSSTSTSVFLCFTLAFMRV